MVGELLFMEFEAALVQVGSRVGEVVGGQLCEELEGGVHEVEQESGAGASPS